MMQTIKIVVFMFLLFIVSCTMETKEHKFEGQNLVYTELADSWDEAVPLGNGLLGNLVWQKNGKLRFSLDRSDLWDLRPMKHLDFNKWKFSDVYEHWKNDDYEKVQQAFDVPYDQRPAPSKIPAGALEFNIEKLGKIKKVELDIENATCVVEWESGTKLTTYIHAEKPVGWYRFENLENPVKIDLISPAYNRKSEEGFADQAPNELMLLGYEQGKIIESGNSITYNQKGWGDFRYQIHTEWIQGKNSIEGCWSISSENPGWAVKPNATEVVEEAFKNNFEDDYDSHLKWWAGFWNKSSISIPDSVLQRQYYLEIYKFGSIARADTPPISLQAVWTADNGKLPPWKGDFHNDLNTQLSYWPSYAGNYLDMEEGFVNWLWNNRSAYFRYTKAYFGVEGMNVPGVTTLEGEPMGGWIQYSLGQTVAAWLGHHFYLHWQFTRDRDFLKERAYPWLRDVSVFLDEISIKENGKRKLLISSSPEIYNNSRKAWFAETTNFDLALIKWNLEKTVELARELGLDEEAEKWEQQLAEWPELTVDSETGFMFAPGFPYNESHRHFSHLMAFHPLGLVDYSKGENDKKIIENTLRNLEAHGPDYWTGYSYSWLGNLYARAFDGNKAAEVLRIFARCFCLKNSFHVNGDQCTAGYSTMTYRPFTLEGNFAFASGIQEMLLQSHTGIVKVFPAIPHEWKEASFKNLRTYGAFLVTAELKEGEVNTVKIKSEKGGTIKLQNPFENKGYKINTEDDRMNEGVITIQLKAGEEVQLFAVDE